MIFLRPTAFYWALLAVPLVVFYLREVRPARKAVGTGFLWRQVFRETSAGVAWRKWRRPISLGLHLTVLALVVLAMAEPTAQPPGSPLWPYPAAAALLLVAVEWCLFERRWTC